MFLTLPPAALSGLVNLKGATLLSVNISTLDLLVTLNTLDLLAKMHWNDFGSHSLMQVQSTSGSLMSGLDSGSRGSDDSVGTKTNDLEQILSQPLTILTPKAELDRRRLLPDDPGGGRKSGSEQ